jgi:serine/threonine-protein kinase
MTRRQVSDSRWRLGERFELLGQVGTGASGTVWRGIELADGSEHAVKLLRPELVAEPEAVAGLYATLDVVARLAHPGVVAVDDAALGAGWFALRSPLLAAENLRTAFGRQAAMAPAHAALLVAQLCDTLAAAHAVGLAHGDLHPCNVLLVPGLGGLAQARVTDFGMAALINRAAARGARTTAPPADYRAPELATGEPGSPAADVYALGALLYQALAGRPPFVAPRASGVAEMHLRDQPDPIPYVSDSLWRLVAAALEKGPRYRPTAAQLASALRADMAASGTAAMPAAFTAPRPGPDAATTLLPPVAAAQDAVPTRMIPGAPYAVAGAGHHAPDRHSAARNTAGSRVPRVIREHKTESGIAAAVAVVGILIGAALSLAGGGSAGAATAAGSSVLTAPPVPAATSPTAQAVVLPPAVSPSPSPSPLPSTATGVITLVNAQSGTCMDTAGRIFANGTTEDIYTCNGTPAQVWNLTAAGQLTQDGGAFCLDDNNSDNTPGARVQLWSCNGGANQQWVLQPNGSITGVSSGLCVDVNGETTADGTALVLWPCNGHPSELWSRR